MKYLFLLLQLAVLQTVYGQSSLEKDPWSKNQLMEPAQLSHLLKASTPKPLILNIGSEKEIKGALHIGSANDKFNMAKLEREISRYPQNKLIVLYCGCCPFNKCPNIHPAFSLLKKKKFNRFHLLNLPHNIRTDWIENGYLMADN